MQKITPIIIEAMQKAIQKEGSQAIFAKKMGIAQSVLSRYLSGNVKGINNRTWLALYPKIKEYLPTAFCGDVPISMTRVIEREIFGITGRDDEFVEESDTDGKYTVIYKFKSGQEIHIPMSKETFILWKKNPSRAYILSESISRFEMLFVKCLITNHVLTKDEAISCFPECLKDTILSTPEKK